jgi:D-glycero-D-manno-heptose 1,7-bisphosphate phosphatase
MTGEGMYLTRRRALFLDRDGVINVERGYVGQRESFEFVDGIFELCKHAKNLGYLIFVVTNQAGIGRGYYSEQDFLSLTEWMCGVFVERGAPIDRVYFCPYHPEYGVGVYKMDSPFRKPAPGMILQAAKDFDVDLTSSILVGDKGSDIQAGLAAGVGCKLFYCASHPESHRGDHIAADATIHRLVDGISFIGM